MRRLTTLCCVVLTTTLAAPAASQQRRFELPGGGFGIFLDGAADHTMIVRPTVDGVRLECIRGDHHAAAVRLTTRDRVAAPGDVAMPGSEASATDARTLRATVNANMRFDADVPTGVDDDGRVLLYTPKPLDPGSSYSHFDTRASPDLLMEPALSPVLPFADVDLTDDALRDMGWRAGRFRSEVSVTDDENSGFNDSELGADRRAALVFMLGIWERLLGSASRVRVEAGFAELTCSVEEGAILAQAGPRFVFTDFRGGEPGVWYPGPMAKSIARSNLDEDDVDIGITFNASIDDACRGPGTSWYYGVDGSTPPQQVSFVAVALHEIAHGLGFLGLTDLDRGAFFRNLPDIFATMTFDNQRNRTWDELSRVARRKSAVRDGQVAFTGAKTQRGARPLLRGAYVLQIADPPNLAGTHIVGRAFFGPELDEDGVTNELALADDGSATSTLACQPLVNGAEVYGKIAVVDRGECFFVDKVQAAQDAGAVGVVVANNVAGPAVNMGGETGSITIPAVMVDRDLGKKIKRWLGR